MGFLTKYLSFQKWSIAIDLLKEVYGSLQMFVFILEEATQSMGMAVYLSYKAEDYAECAELAQYALDEIIRPSLGWLANYHEVVWPTGIAYAEFFLASEKSMERFISLCAEQ